MFYFSSEREISTYCSSEYWSDEPSPCICSPYYGWTSHVQTFYISKYFRVLKLTSIFLRPCKLLNHCNESLNVLLDSNLHILYNDCSCIYSSLNYLFFFSFGTKSLEANCLRSRSPFLLFLRGRFAFYFHKEFVLLQYAQLKCLFILKYFI